VGHDSIHSSVIAEIVKRCPNFHVYLSGSDGDLNIFVNARTYEECEQERIRENFSHHLQVNDIVGSKESGFLYVVTECNPDKNYIKICNNIRGEPTTLFDRDVKEAGDNWFKRGVRA